MVESKATRRSRGGRGDVVEHEERSDYDEENRELG